MGLQREGQRRMFMWLILLEALLALLLLTGIVWWTMFSGRRNGEPPAQAQTPDSSEKGSKE
jgi:cytoskeletal protein RodZ